ncbi:MAG: hypothetical protein JWN56_1474 [Sphingobacteriales bacterium]|nr:hypothetical protein [Sphingobacteriales bacterium]
MKSGLIKYLLVLITLLPISVSGRTKSQNFSFDFFGHTFNFSLDSSLVISYSDSLSESSIIDFYNTANKAQYTPLANALLSYKDKYNLNDWIYYQLIRKTAQQISPKADNYNRYTLYKWFLLTKSGYDAKLVLGKNHLFFYVKSDDNIADIPFYESESGQQYVCLNIHDYKNIHIDKEQLFPVEIKVAGANKSFSYKVTRLPDFKPEDYSEKSIEFNYKQKVYHFNVKVNPNISTIFANYPGVDFGTYFNIPLSRETYSSLIPLLKRNISKMSQKKGVDYLMRFTRYSFLYENDDENFGKEKHLLPEQTLLYEKSDCDDRAALFFFLVKEIYNLPMIAMLYPTHITMAVQFDKPIGNPILYKGKTYTVCEPTPQMKDLKIGQISANLKQQPYKVVYQYEP